jgi:hypothetical protein
VNFKRRSRNSSIKKKLTIQTIIPTFNINESCMSSGTITSKNTMKPFQAAWNPTAIKYPTTGRNHNCFPFLSPHLKYPIVKPIIALPRPCDIVDFALLTTITKVQERIAPPSPSSNPVRAVAPKYSRFSTTANPTPQQNPKISPSYWFLILENRIVRPRALKNSSIIGAIKAVSTQSGNE